MHVQSLPESSPHACRALQVPKHLLQNKAECRSLALMWDKVCDV